MHLCEIGHTKHQNENSESFKKINCQNQKLADFICHIGWNFGENEYIEFIDFLFIEIKLQNIQMKKNFQELSLQDDVSELKKKI